jgi:hypothetical protein
LLGDVSVLSVTATEVLVDLGPGWDIIAFDPSLSQRHTAGETPAHGTRKARDSGLERCCAGPLRCLASTVEVEMVLPLRAA